MTDLIGLWIFSSGYQKQVPYGHPFPLYTNVSTGGGKGTLGTMLKMLGSRRMKRREKEATAS